MGISPLPVHAMETSKLLSLFGLQGGQFIFYINICHSYIRVCRMEKYGYDSPPQDFVIVCGVNLVCLRFHGRFDTGIICQIHQKVLT